MGEGGDRSKAGAGEYPNDLVAGCRFGNSREWDLPRFLRRDPRPVDPEDRVSRLAWKVMAIAVCTAVVALGLPGVDTLDFWVAMATFLTALVVASTL